MGSVSQWQAATYVGYNPVDDSVSMTLRCFAMEQDGAVLGMVFTWQRGQLCFNALQGSSVPFD